MIDPDGQCRRERWMMTKREKWVNALVDKPKEEVTKKIMAILENRDTRLDQLNTEIIDLREMLHELLDSHYGMASHHIGDGDGIGEDMAEKIRAYWDAQSVNPA